jgi:uncharacterized protein
MRLDDLTRLDASKLTDETAAELSMVLIAAARQRSRRSCGSCSQCCKTLSIDAPELQKPMDRWCEHCAPGKGGCRVYIERPNICKAFACGWLLNANIDEAWWPARSKIVIHYHRIGPEIICSFIVDASYPHRWREEPFYSDIKRAALAGLSQRDAGHFLVHVEIGERKILILPSREIEVGTKAHVIAQTGPQQWDALVFETPERAQEVVIRANAIVNRIATYPAGQQDALLFQLNRELVAKLGTPSEGRGKAAAR